MLTQTYPQLNKDRIDFIINKLINEDEYSSLYNKLKSRTTISNNLTEDLSNLIEESAEVNEIQKKSK